MRTLLVGVSLLALAAPAARAQQADEPAAAAVSGQAEPGSFLVYFGFNKATLDASARRVVAEAADEYKRTGAAQIAVTGYADKAGRPAYNQRLSERRAEAVRRELERLGVPSLGRPGGRRGRERPRRPDRGRRARGPEPPGRDRDAAAGAPAAPPPAVAAAPPPPPVAAEPAAAPPPERPKRFVFSLGPIYGHNFREKDHRGGGTQDDFAGAELTLSALPGFLGGVSLKQDMLCAFNASTTTGWRGARC